MLPTPRFWSVQKDHHVEVLSAAETAKDRPDQVAAATEAAGAEAHDAVRRERQDLGPEEPQERRLDGGALARPARDD